MSGNNYQCLYMADVIAILWADVVATIDVGRCYCHVG